MRWATPSGFLCDGGRSFIRSDDSRRQRAHALDEAGGAHVALHNVPYIITKAGLQLQGQLAGEPNARCVLEAAALDQPQHLQGVEAQRGES